MLIRAETECDREAIHALVADAFGKAGEATLVDALRQDGVLVISLVAEEAGRLLGHVAMSHLKSPPNTLALAPLSVVADRRQQGIGSALVRAAIELSRDSGFDVVFVLGEPSTYARFGFSTAAAERFASPFAGSYFQALELSDVPIPAVPVHYARAFSDLE
ncbi:MAG: GNAT family N-acetyltransferase [Hyphomicrobium sp.]